MKRLFLFSLLPTIVFSAESIKNFVSAPEIGIILKLADYNKNDAELQHSIENKNSNVSLEVSDIYGIYGAYPLTNFLYAYGNLYYQYSEVNLLNQSFLKQTKFDIHETSLELGLDLRILLYRMQYMPMNVHLNLKAGVISGYALHKNSQFDNSAIFGYSHSLGILFQVYHHYVFNCGFDFYHHYSRANAKNKINGKSNSLLLDYDNSGNFYLSIGYKF